MYDEMYWKQKLETCSTYEKEFDEFLQFHIDLYWVTKPKASTVIVFFKREEKKLSANEHWWNSYHPA